MASEPPEGRTPGFSPEIAGTLRNADRTIRMMRGRRRKLYNMWRVTMAGIAPVDSFYVAFYGEGRLLAVPYVFDGEEYEPPGHQMYGPDGLSAWMKRHARPYLYSMDNGRLLHMGHSFGADERLSRDTVAVPLLDPTADGGPVVGLASIQSYAPDVYGSETVHAFEFLARSVVTVLAREREDVANRASLDLVGDDEPDSPLSVLEIVDGFVETLEKIRVGLEESIHLVPPQLSMLNRRLVSVRELCRQAQTDAAEVILTPSVDLQGILESLTPREREIAELVADGLANERIAERLQISEATVKTHVTRILKKFGARQRAAVAARLRPFG
ncbi:LuxR family transcriptional regulator [Kutzneria sp. 744]|uniref:helix-turn-helix transcriptional regulator n=1 Tax=Kutzneria sp. (strain 744) TaxID=345341 RepID=UPI0003EEAEB7|nr:LuxR-family transcriptional regulator [Kutzneria sp. 744]